MYDLAPTLQRQNQPFGKAGIEFSLQKVAQMATDSREHPMLRAWVSRVLDRAGRPVGGLPRAKAIYDALMKQCFWMPDPTDTEFMTGAHLLLGDGEHRAVFSAGDCDDLTIALVAAFLCGCESAGVRTAVVGHAYDKAGNISHVLAAIWVPDPSKPKGGEWIYVDPSAADLPFGQCDKFTNEIIYTAPGAQKVCEAEVCLNTGRAYTPSEAPTGRFVGVAGRELPEGFLVTLPDAPLGNHNSTLGARVETAAAAAWTSYLAAAAPELRSVAAELDAAYNAAVSMGADFGATSAQMERFGFTRERFDLAQNAKTAALFIAGVCEDVLTKKRIIETTQDGLDFVIESLETDPFVLGLSPDGKGFAFLDRAGNPAAPQLSSVGSPITLIELAVFVTGVIAVVAIIGEYISLAKQALQSLVIVYAEVCKTISMWRYTGLVNDGNATPQQAGDLAAKIAESESLFLGTAKAAAKQTADNSSEIETILTQVLIGGAIAAGVVLTWKWIQKQPDRRKATKKEAA